MNCHVSKPRLAASTRHLQVAKKENDDGCYSDADGGERFSENQSVQHLQRQRNDCLLGKRHSQDSKKPKNGTAQVKEF
ncbi:MAG: hypothetical protein ACLRR3_11990, partial [Eubacterium sp.]